MNVMYNLREVASKNATTGIAPFSYYKTSTNGMDAENTIRNNMFLHLCVHLHICQKKIEEKKLETKQLKTKYFSS